MKRLKLTHDGHGVILAGRPKHSLLVCQLEPEYRKLAPLFAASKDLLAALERIVNDAPSPGEDAQLTAAGYNQACAAITKAKGTP